MRLWKYLRTTAQLLLMGCCLFFSTGLDYYVETYGSDNFDVNGSDTNPWQTVGHALSETISGDTIIIGAGEFREFLNITNSVTISGQNTYSAGNPPLNRHTSITAIRAPGASPAGDIIYVATNNVTIQNLTLYGDPDTNGVGMVLQGIRTTHRPVTVTNCTIANIYGRGIRCLGTTPPPAATDNSAFRSYLGYNLISNITHDSAADGILLEQTQATCEFNEISGINGASAHAGIYLWHSDYTSLMGQPNIVRSNFFNDCKVAIWANEPVSNGETLQIEGNTVTNSVIGIKVSGASGPAHIVGNSIHVTGISSSGTPARGIWIDADANPWSTTQATDHVVISNTLMSAATTNDRTVGMLFTYAATPAGLPNNGVRATVLTNYVYNFAIGSLVESGTNNVVISNTPLVEVAYHYNDIYGSVVGAILTTGFSYTVDATSNFLGYSDPSNTVSTNVDYTGWSMGSWTINTDGDGLIDRADPDDDNDGILDGDEVTIGTYPTRADSDYDGMNDPQEYYVAGTDPTNSASVLRMNAFNWTATNGATFEWPSVTGRTYYVYRTTNLIEGFGSPITNFPPSVDPTNYFADTNATGTIYFYQVSVTNLP